MVLKKEEIESKLSEVEEKLKYFKDKGNEEVELECRTTDMYLILRGIKRIGEWGVNDIGNRTIRFRRL